MLGTLHRLLAHPTINTVLRIHPVTSSPGLLISERKERSFHFVSSHLPPHLHLVDHTERRTLHRLLMLAHPTINTVLRVHPVTSSPGLLVSERKEKSFHFISSHLHLVDHTERRTLHRLLMLAHPTINTVLHSPGLLVSERKERSFHLISSHLPPHLHLVDHTERRTLHRLLMLAHPTINTVLRVHPVTSSPGLLVSERKERSFHFVSRHLHLVDHTERRTLHRLLTLAHPTINTLLRIHPVTCSPGLLVSERKERSFHFVSSHLHLVDHTERRTLHRLLAHPTINTLLRIHPVTCSSGLLVSERKEKSFHLVSSHLPPHFYPVQEQG